MSPKKEAALPDLVAPEVREEAVDFLQLLVEQVVDYAIFAIDPEGNIASWNLGAQRIKGYTPAEIIGKPYALFFSKEDQVSGKPGQILGQARAHGRVEAEGWRVRKDGSRFWASVVVTALKDHHGALRGFAKITRDLTERKAAEEEARRAAEERAARRQAEIDEREVRRSRDQVNLILKSISEGVTAQKLDGTLIFANDAAAILCGFTSAQDLLEASREEILTKFEVSREDGTPFPLDELPGALALRGETSTAVVRFRVKRTGEERWSFVSGTPVADSEGRVEFAVNVFREFTERKRAEDAWHYLAEASAALGTSLDYEATLKQVAVLAVPRIADWCGVEILDADGKLDQLAVAHVDPAKRELAEEWRRRWPPPREAAPYKVVRTGQPEIIPEITDEMIDAGTPDPEQRRLTRELGLRSAMVVPLRVGDRPFGVLSFVTAESGRLYGAQDLILATEVARRASLAVENARAFTEAKNAVQTRDSFLAIASHELRTPLSGLTMVMTSLVRVASQDRLGELGSEGLKSRLMKADRQTKQLAHLIDRLLDVSKLSTRDLLLERERVDLVELARDIISRCEESAAEKGSRIELKCSGPIVGWLDRSRIDQAITNLIGNAIKYGAGTPITVSLSSGGSGNLRITVRDEGPGIAPEDQERIFGQFERANPSEDLHGMGLGLWLVRRIVAAHGGTVSLDSRPAQGATFTIIVPTRGATDPAPGDALPIDEK